MDERPLKRVGGENLWRHKLKSGMNDPRENSDPWLDARLRNVPLPLDFLARLEQIADPEIARMDRALMDVPLPDGFLERLSDISRAPRRRAAWRQLALAASVLISIGVGYGSWTVGGGAGRDVAGLAGAGRNLATKKTSEVASSQSPATSGRRGSPKLGDSRSTTSKIGPDREPSQDVRRDDAERVADHSSGPDANAASANSQQVAEINPTAPSQPADQGLAGQGLAGQGPSSQGPSSVVVVENVAVATPSEVPANVASSGNARLAPASAKSPREMQFAETLGAADRFEELPDLEAVRAPVARGMSPPLVAGYDLRFLLNHRQHPFVVPALDKSLQTVAPPLVTSAAGFRQLVRSVAEGRAPAPEDVRTEEFLAALDYGFPAAPAGSVAIEAAAGLAPLSEEGWSLLQVAVHAGPLRKADRPATQLTLVVDASASMRQADRWLALQQALGQLVDDMSPADRLTLIAYTAEPELLAENLSREEINHDGSGHLERLLAAVEARPAANVALAMQTACGLSAHAAPGAAKLERHTLLISGGRVDSGVQAAQRMRQRVAELAKSGVKMNVLDFSRRERATGPLDAWAQAAQGKLVRVSDATSLHWHLQSALLGHPPVVAERTSLKINFNPKVVASYRLFGHDRATLTGPAAAETEINLRSGETATVLFELSLKPDADQRVATIEAKWQEPNQGPRRSASRELKRDQFAPTFAGSPSSLQMAAVAAFAAETLRGSPFAPASRSLAPVNDLAKQVAKSIPDQVSFGELATFLQQAERVRKHGAAGLKNASPGAGDR